MAALPSPTQVAGNHSAIYEAYYNVVDPNGFGTVGGMDAARFLKRSGLSDVILSKIWDLSDPGGRGCLDKSGMFVAMKLVALVQNGKDLNVSHIIDQDVPPPKMGDVPLPKPKPAKPPLPPPANIAHHNTTSNTPLITSLPASAVDWTVKPSEREKYDKLFDSLQPANGLIPGNKVKNVLLESKLPFETLGKIWDLADQDKDGMLDRYEFVAAMHLVYKALEKYAIPNTLPPELVPPIKKNASLTGGNNTPTPPLLLNRGMDGVKPDVSPPPPTHYPAAVAPVTAAPPISKPVQSVQPTLPWVVTADEKIKSDALFVKSDVDKDGFVSGQEIKDVFLQSGVPQMVLAHIWALCDIKQSGKLNNEQFALAMWFIARCLKGIEPPPALTPEMVPPSFRTNKVTDGLVENNNTRYSNPELDMISKDIEELTREKLALEADIAQKEADLKIKTGEIKNLQSELDTLAATLKQLENQKGEAQKRLNDLRLQWYDNEKALGEISNDIVDTTSGVDKLRTQAAEQAEAVSAQEAELNSKKQQLEGLRQEEQRLEKERDESTNKLQHLSMSLQESQLSISQAKALITQLQEQTRQMNDAIQACDAAISTGDVTIVPDTILRIEPDFRDPEYTKIGLVNGNKENNPHDDADDPFKSNAPVNSTSGFTENLFKNDPFKEFGADDPFNSAFSKSQDGFSSDPFGGVGFSNSESKADPFDAFADSRKNSSAGEEADKDPFGCDPFAVLHAPTRDASSAPPPPRPTSPSPALPPKKSKQPPPRPAPPRPMQPPSMKKFNNNDDGFGSSGDPFGFGGGAGGFADFTDFDTKRHVCDEISVITEEHENIVLLSLQELQQTCELNLRSAISHNWGLQDRRKLCGFFCNKWREEWFILYEDSTLEWYTEKGINKPRGRIRIGEAPELLAVGEWTSQAPKRPPFPHVCHIGQFLAIGSKTSRNVHWLMAQSPAEVNDWMTAISNTLPPPPHLPLENNYIYLPSRRVRNQQQRRLSTNIPNGSCYRTATTTTTPTTATSATTSNSKGSTSTSSPLPPSRQSQSNSNHRPHNQQHYGDADYTVMSGVVIDWGHGWGWGHNAWTLHSAVGGMTYACGPAPAADLGGASSALHCNSLEDYTTDGFDEADWGAFGDFAF